MSNEFLSLANLYDGAAIEAVDHEIQRVLENITDPNTLAKKDREVILKIKFKPDESRSIPEVSFHAESKLQPAAPLKTTVILDRDRKGKTVAREMRPGRGVPGQGKLPVDEAPEFDNPKVKPINQGGNKE